jgi:hypothetical protein
MEKLLNETVSRDFFLCAILPIIWQLPPSRNTNYMCGIGHLFY